MNIRTAKDNEIYSPRNPNHYYINNNSPLFKITLRDLSSHEIALIEPFVRKYSNHEYWKKIREQLSLDPKKIDTQKIKLIIKRLQEATPLLNEIHKIPKNAILFGSNKSLLNRAETYIKRLGLNDIFKAATLMPHAAEIINEIDKLRLEAHQMNQRVKYLNKISHIQNNNLIYSIKNKSKILSDKAEDLERQIFNEINFQRIKNNEKIILDIGYKYHNWKTSATSMKKIITRAIEHQERMIEKFQDFINRCESTEGRRAICGQYGADWRSKLRTMPGIIQEYKANLELLKRDDKTIQRQMSNRMQAYLNQGNKKTIREHFIHYGGDNLHIDQEGYDRYILSLYKKFFRPSSKIIKNSDGTISFTWATPEDSLSKSINTSIRMPLHYLTEIKEHGEYVENIQQRYDDILDYRDYSLRKWTVTNTKFVGKMNAVEREIAESVHFRNQSSYRSGKAGTDFENRFNYHRVGPGGNVFRINFEEWQDREAEIRYHRGINVSIKPWTVEGKRHSYANGTWIHKRETRNATSTVGVLGYGQGIVGYDTNAKWHPRWQPRSVTHFSFGRVVSDSNNLDALHNRLDLQLERINKREPIDPKGRYVYNAFGKKIFLSYAEELRRRNEYLQSKMFRTYIDGTQAVNIRKPWNEFLRIRNLIDKATHPDQIAPIGMQIYHFLHPQGIEGSVSDAYLPELNVPANSPNLFGLHTPETKSLISHLNKKSFILGDPSVTVDATHYESEVEHEIASIRWLGQTIRERMVNGHDEARAFHEERFAGNVTIFREGKQVEEMGRVYDPTTSAHSFENDERFAAIKTGIPRARRVSLENMEIWRDHNNRLRHGLMRDF